MAELQDSCENQIAGENSIFTLVSRIGKGTFCDVFKAIRESDNLPVAIKKVNSRHALINQKNRGLRKRIKLMMKNEAEVLQKLDHPNVITLFETINVDNINILVLQFAKRGDLFERIAKHGCFSENDSRGIMMQILEGTNYIHQQGIIHRDLKPENILFIDKKRIVIADFGFSRFQSDGVMSHCGTLDYTAPELLRESLKGKCCHYTEKVDCWSIGAINYILICGYPPFISKMDDELKLAELIIAGKFDFDSPHWVSVSCECQFVISNLLILEPELRYSCKQALEQAWFKI